MDTMDTKLRISINDQIVLDYIARYHTYPAGSRTVFSLIRRGMVEKTRNNGLKLTEAGAKALEEARS